LLARRRSRRTLLRIKFSHWRAKLEDVLTCATGNDVSTLGLARFDIHQNQPPAEKNAPLGCVLRTILLETERTSDIISVRQLL
jgi:hypothetical protein